MKKHMATGKTTCRLEMYTWQLFHHTGNTKTILQQCMKRGRAYEMHKVKLSTQIQKGAGATAQFAALHFKTGMTTWSKLTGRIVKIDHSSGRQEERLKKLGLLSWKVWQKFMSSSYFKKKRKQSSCSEDLSAETAQKKPKVRCNRT